MKRIPLAVYIIRHPNFAKGEKIVHRMYSELNRSYCDVKNITCNIPVYFAEGTDKNNYFIPIDEKQAERTAVFVLVDKENMYTACELNVDGEWSNYLQEIKNKSDTGSHTVRFFPVAVDDVCINDMECLKRYNINYIRMYADEDRDNRFTLIDMKHELCRMMLGMEEAKDAGTTRDVSAERKVCVFLSHAKADGKDIMERMHTFIHSRTGLQDFMDCEDIGRGDDFEESLKRHARQSNLLIALRTDRYSQREYCNMEILVAKKNKIPILIVDNLLETDERVFPYMGNVKAIRYRQERENGEQEFFVEVISNALSEILKKLYYRETIRTIADVFDIKISNNHIFDYSPEIFSLLAWVDGVDDFIVYPSPPLNQFEVDMLKENKMNQYKMVTPVNIPSLKYGTDRNLKGVTVGISMSEMREDEAENRGLSNVHFKAVSVEIARNLLANQANLTYSGSLNYGNADNNFLDNLKLFVGQYNKEHSREEKKRIQCYVAAYLQEAVHDKCPSGLEGSARYIQIPACDIGKVCFLPDDMAEKIRRVFDLYNMRAEMNKNTNALIALRGKTTGFQGLCPGVLQEVMMALKSKKPVYLLGGFGGMTEEIGKCLIGEKSKWITYRDGRMLENENRVIQVFNKCVQDIKSTGVYENFSYREIGRQLNSMGFQGLHNGLSEEQNYTLLASRNIDEIMPLLIAGLYKCLG